MPPQDFYINKVVYFGETLIDLTADTATAGDVLRNKTFHDASGALVSGTCDYDAKTTDATATAAEILNTKTAYKNGAKLTGTMPNVGKQTGTISTKAGSVAISAGYHDGSGSVSLDATEAAKLIPANIAEGTTLFGVVGAHSSGSAVNVEASKSVTPSNAQQTVLPSSGYDAIGQVVVAAVPYTRTTNSAGGATVTIG